MPKRIQRKRTKGWRKPENCVIVSRPSRWGNPFWIGRRIEDAAFTEPLIVDAATCKELFLRDLEWKLIENPDWLEPLRGKDLACFCPEDAEWCHADELLRLANAER